MAILLIPLDLRRVTDHEVWDGCRALEDVPGVERAMVNRQTETLMVRYRPRLLDEAELLERAARLFSLDGRQPSHRPGPGDKG